VFVLVGGRQVFNDPKAHPFIKATHIVIEGHKEHAAQGLTRMSEI